MMTKKILIYQRWLFEMHCGLENHGIIYRSAYRFLCFSYNQCMSLFFSAYIPASVKIGKNLWLPHSFHGIFMSKNAVIGDNCTILHHVTIGSNIHKKDGDKESPILGNNIFIGCNVCIIGKTVLEDNVKVGAGSTLVDIYVPNGATVVSQKSKIIEKLN